MGITFTLNGHRVEADDFDPNVTLLQFLRERGLTGSKEGCAEGECGACAVVVVRRDADGKSSYEPVNGCLFLLASAAGREIWSVEGVARDGKLHPVQQAMVDTAGSQCGYCTPGFVMSLFAEYYRGDRDGYDPEAIGGNLCRCTGYRPIRDVASSLGVPGEDDPFRARLERPGPELAEVRYQSSARRYFRPTSLDAAIGLLKDEAGAKLIAGGTDLVVEINQRHARFDTLISLENVSELFGIEWTEKEVTIGAGSSLTDIERAVRGRLPLLEQLFPLFSSRLIRNRATLGGNLMTASPIGDSPPALLALDAAVELVGPDGRRRVPLSEFFLGYRKTAARSDEVLSRVVLPLPLPDHQRFYKVSKRVMDDISTVAAGFSLRLDGESKIAEARLGYGGVAATPVRALDAEAALVGEPWNEDAVRKVEPLLARAFSPISDHRGSADYRATMVVRLFQKFFAETRGGGS
jgi:xanthine dehydrogenase small subunit